MLEEILRVAPGYGEAHYSLGKALVEEGQLDRAMQELEEAVRLDPAKAYSHYQLGRAYWKAGKTSAAQREFDLARQLKDTATRAGQRSEP